MTATPPITPTIVISPSGQQVSSHKHNDQNDDYLRLISSPTGQYLGSISNRRQLTLFQINDPSQFTAWTENNVLHLAFSESERQIAVLTRSPSVKLFQIRPSVDSAAKSIELLHEQKGQAMTTYGWVVWSLDNQYIIYAKNEDLMAMRVNNFQQFPLTSDRQIITLCAPHYLVIDRVTKQLMSASRNGRICTYNIELPSDRTTDPLTRPVITILKTTRLSPSQITIAQFDQGTDFLISSTTAMTQNRQTFYSTYIISKLDVNSIWQIQLRQELIVPPLMMQADSVGKFVVGFLKGERSLYVYDIGDVIATVGKEGKDGESVSNRVLPHRQKIELPYLLHAINYNRLTNKLILGTTGANNQDRIVQTDFSFNCSSIAVTPLRPIRQTCTAECQLNDSGSHFSLIGGRCKAISEELSEKEKKCMGSYEWSLIEEKCELRCERVGKSISRVGFNLPQECICEQNYVWSGRKVECEAVDVSGAISSNITDNNSGTETNSNKPPENTASNNSITNNTATHNNTTTTTTNSNSNAVINNSTTSSNNTYINDTTTINNSTTTAPTNNNNSQINGPTNPPAVTPSKPTPTHQTTNKNNQTLVPPTPSDTPFNVPINEEDKNNSVTIVLSVLTVILIFALALSIYLYKKKKLCFKPKPYVQDNELKESDIRSQSNPTDKNSQISNHEHKSSQSHQSQSSDQKNKPSNIGASPECPAKQFNFMEQLNEPVDEFVIEEIISDSMEQQNDCKTDSERKFY